MLHLWQIWQSFGELLTTTRVYARAAVLSCERRNHLQQNDLASLLLRPKCQHTAAAIAPPRRIPRISGVLSFRASPRGNRGIDIDMDLRVMAGASKESSVMDATIGVIVGRLRDPVEYVCRVLQNTKGCEEKFRNSVVVRIGVTGVGCGSALPYRARRGF